MGPEFLVDPGGIGLILHGDHAQGLLHFGAFFGGDCVMDIGFFVHACPDVGERRPAIEGDAQAMGGNMDGQRGVGGRPCGGLCR